MKIETITRQTHQEWIIEGKQKYGDDYKKWKFKCPACSHISSVQDFIDAGADWNKAYQECIGRINGKGEDGFKGKDKGFGCNWAAYGLFGTLNSGKTVIHKGKNINVFDFAD
jgi:hypothetical protein